MPNSGRNYLPALLRLTSIACFSAMALCVRFASFEAPIGQIVCFRGLFALLPLVSYVFWQGGFRSGFTPYVLRQHIIRGCVGATALVCAFISYAYLPLAEATLFTFLTPITSLIFSTTALKEKLSPLVAFAALLGTLGVVVALSEQLQRSDGFSLEIFGIVCGISGAVLSSGAYVLVRKLTAIEPSSRIGFYFALILTVVAAPSMAWGWAVPSANLWFILAGAGILGGVGHIAMTEAFARSTVSNLAPYEYTSLFWSLLFDAAILQIFPTALTFAGGLLIIGAAVLASMARKPQNQPSVFAVQNTGTVK